MKSNTILNQLGLAEHEGIVYTALLETGAATVSTIAKHAGIHRPMIYKALVALAERGLVTLIPKGKQKRYAAESPEKLRALAATRAEELSAALDDLHRRYETSGARPAVRYLEGRRGLKAVLEDLTATLKRGGIFYRYSSRKTNFDVERYVPKEYRSQRDAKQLEQFVITNEALKKGAYRRRLGCASKAVPVEKDAFDYNIAQLIYGNKVALVDYNTETAIIIENPMIAKFQERLFRLLFAKL